MEPQAEPAAARGSDVLILDDEPQLSEMLALVLGRDHRVRVAGSARDAFAMIAERLPDVLLCDLMLGGETAGGFLRAVKCRWPGVWCVLHTGAAIERWHGLLRDSVVDAILIKPADYEQIVGAVTAR
ncbi:MAG TPA: response regulator [Polyangia bacterium]|jgi:DNA-binding NtrC family response regulator